MGGAAIGKKLVQSVLNFPTVGKALPEAAKKTAQFVKPQATAALSGLTGGAPKLNAGAGPSMRQSMLPTLGGKPLSSGIGSTIMNMAAGASHLTSPTSTGGKILGQLSQQASASSDEAQMKLDADRNARMTMVSTQIQMQQSMLQALAKVMEQGPEAAKELVK